jgi:hypothetical protein
MSASSTVQSEPKRIGRNPFVGNPRVLQTSVAFEDLYRDITNNEMEKVHKSVYLRVLAEIIHENRDTFMSAVVHQILAKVKKKDLIQTAIKRAAEGKTLIKQHREIMAKFILALAKVLGKLYKGHV